MTGGQTCLIRPGFPCGGCSKDLKQKKKRKEKALDLMLCQTALRFQRYRPCEVLDKLKISVVVFLFFVCPGSTVWRLPAKYPACNRSWVFSNHLNKHKEKPATDMQTIWNETSSCVFSSRFSLGCSVDYQ